jgi:hypothetical protein
MRHDIKYTALPEIKTAGEMQVGDIGIIRMMDDPYDGWIIMKLNCYYEYYSIETGRRAKIHDDYPVQIFPKGSVLSIVIGDDNE